MRKLWIALAAALVTALSVAGVASAVNTYEVDIADAASGKGSLARPIPTAFDFGYEVGDTNNQRPEVIRQYRIAAEGLYSYPDAQLSAACRRAFVGDGSISNHAGAPNDRSQKLQCDVDLTLINISSGDPRYPSDARQVRRRGGMAIRIDTFQPEGSRCPIPVHEALAAPFFNVKIQGIRTSELRFPVPDPQEIGDLGLRRGQSGRAPRPAGAGREAQGWLLLAGRAQGRDASRPRDLRGRVGRPVHGHEDVPVAALR